MRDTSNGRRGEPGFTLFEVLLALVVMATALFAVFRLQAQSLDLQSESRFITQANFLLQQRLALLYAARTLKTGANSGSFDEPYEDYSYSEEIVTVPDRNRLYRIRVEVAEAGEKPQRTLSQEIYLYRSS